MKTRSALYLITMISLAGCDDGLIINDLGLDASLPDTTKDDAVSADMPPQADAQQPDQAAPDTTPLDAGLPKTPWAVGAGGTSDDRGRAIALDSSGNIYITGSFNGIATLGSFTLTSKGGTDIFVAKVSPAGTFLWAASAGGTGDDVGNGIVVDSSSKVTVTGFINGAATFGTFSTTSKGGKDLFVAQLDTKGNFVWVDSAGGSGDDEATAIVVDTKGDLNITGTFTGTVSIASTSLTSKGKEDIFVAKMTSAGVFTWAKQYGGGAEDLPHDIALDSIGSIYIVGEYWGAIQFGTIYITPTGYSDVFVVKLDSSGKYIWASSFGGASQDYGKGIVVDSAGNSTISGAFSSTAYFNTTTLQAKYLYDLFVAKVGPNGKAQWALSAQGEFSEEASKIAQDSYGNAFLTGFFGKASGSHPWDISFGNTTFIAKGGYDIFAAKVHFSGKQFSGAKQAGGTGYEEGLDIARDSQGNIYMVGFFSGTASFGSTNLTAKDKDIYIWKLGAGDL